MNEDRESDVSEVATKRKLLEQANLLVKTNDATTTFVACAALLDALGALMSEWTGEVVRVVMTADGQPDALDMTKQPSGDTRPFDLFREWAFPVNFTQRGTAAAGQFRLRSGTGFQPA